MRAHSSLGLIAATALALLVANTPAGAITYNFSGALLAPLNTLPVGTPFTGTFSYDFPQTGTVFPYRGGTVSLYTYTSLSLTVAGQTVTQPSDVLSLANNTDFGDELITGNWFPYGTGVPASSGSIDGITPNFILLDLSDPTGQAFQNSNLPSHLNLADFGINAMIEINTGPFGVGNTTAAETITFLAIQHGEAPVPAALPLFATGLGGLGLLGWRRKRKAQAVA